MLTEHFIASVGVPSKAVGTTVSKDAAIFVHQFQPLPAQQHVFKKSATEPNCLAVSSTHIFAAQSEKAVVHVYSREKGNQEAIVPFTERITCLQLVCDDTVLALGTVEGRTFLWEVASGRQISTSQAHLQAVTALAVDGSGNFLLSASKDSTIHVWSLPALLSFTNDGAQALSPSRSFTLHRAEVTALAIGRNTGYANIAVTASSDKTCLIWDYHTNSVLRTYLLSAAPTCIAIDAAERAVYAGYDDGSIQVLDIYASMSGAASIHSVSKPTLAPIQPPPSSIWRSPENHGRTSSIAVSFDSSLVLSGHENGAICSWDVSRNGLCNNLLQAPLPGPVNNVRLLSVSGFLRHPQRKLRVPLIVKPKFGAFDSLNGSVPNDYASNIEFSYDLTGGPSLTFAEALSAPSFPTALLDSGLHELSSWGRGPHVNGASAQEDSEDFMALDEPATGRTLSLEEQNSALKAEVDALRRLQKASFDKIEKIRLEKRVLMQREDKRLAKSNRGGLNGINTAPNGGITMDDSSSGED